MDIISWCILMIMLKHQIFGLWKRSNVKLVHVIFGMLRMQPSNKRYIARTFKGLGSYPPIGHSFLPWNSVRTLSGTKLRFGALGYSTQICRFLPQGRDPGRCIWDVPQWYFCFTPGRMDRIGSLATCAQNTKIGTWKKTQYECKKMVG